MNKLIFVKFYNTQDILDFTGICCKYEECEFNVYNGVNSSMYVDGKNFKDVVYIETNKTIKIEVICVNDVAMSLFILDVENRFKEAVIV